MYIPKLIQIVAANNCLCAERWKSYLSLLLLEGVSEADVQINGVHGEGDRLEVTFEYVV